eukprot:gene10623-12109_t
MMAGTDVISRSQPQEAFTENLDNLLESEDDDALPPVSQPAETAAPTSFDDAVKQGQAEAAAEAAKGSGDDDVVGKDDGMGVGPKKKKRKKTVRTFIDANGKKQQGMVAYTTIDHDVLLNETKGVAKVAQTFPKIKFAHKKGGESQDLRLLVAHYAKWANELFPSMAFTDFTKKVEELGQK